MRQISLAIILLVSSVSYALHVECVGNTALLDHEGDTLFLFEKLDKNAEIRSKVGNTDWYRLPDTTTAFQSGVDYLYPKHGMGYAIKVDGKWECFWVFDYDSLRAHVDNIVAELTCENTQLLLEGNVPAMQYYNLHKQLTTYPRICQVTYRDQQWDKENNAWIDSIAVAEERFLHSITVGASPVRTDFTVVDQLSVLLNLNEDSLQTVEYDPVAIKAHPQAIVSVRGKQGERTNEVERPIDAETLIKRSAPLEVEFRANALNADHYLWVLFRGSEELINRKEAQHTYVFEEPNNYRATLEMSNEHGCNCQAEDFEISVSASMLEVPNVFTPNGDGTNDEFRVVYRSIKEFHCWIYNRWGHLVYEWTDPAKGWDGTIYGKPAAAGAYYYVIRALGTDAESGYMSKPKYSKKIKKQELPVGVYQLSGDINLLR